MTYLDAAYTILKTAGQPLHYEAIAGRGMGICADNRTQMARMSADER